MTYRFLLGGALLAVTIAMPGSTHSFPAPAAQGASAISDALNGVALIEEVANRGAGTARAGNGNRGNANRGNVNRDNANRGNVNRADVNRTNVNRANINSANVNRANINRANAAVVQPWYRKPYYGTIIGGVALGTIVAATAYGVSPTPPTDGLCWYWSDTSMAKGYWDYCQPQ